MSAWSARSGTIRHAARLILSHLSTVPEAPELHLRSDQASPEELANQVVGLLEARGML